MAWRTDIAYRLIIAPALCSSRQEVHKSPERRGGSIASGNGDSTFVCAGVLWVQGHGEQANASDDGSDQIQLDVSTLMLWSERVRQQLLDAFGQRPDLEA